MWLEILFVVCLLILPLIGIGWMLIKECFRFLQMDSNKKILFRINRVIYKNLELTQHRLRPIKRKVFARDGPRHVG